MNTVEYNLAVSDYTDYYIASPEFEPGCGQEYSCWMNKLGENSDINTFEPGKTMVDGFINFYQDMESPGYGDTATLAVVDSNKLMESSFVSDLDSIAQELRNEAVQASDGDFCIMMSSDL